LLVSNRASVVREHRFGVAKSGMRRWRWNGSGRSGINRKHEGEQPDHGAHA
jgi:hypothetical protein